MRVNNENKYLGKQVDYPQNYDPSILVAIPRYENRQQYGIEENPTIFTGVDVWHAYEFSFLTKNGLPVVGVLKIVYPSDNLYLVESKSLKLYLNSFNMNRVGTSPQQGIDQCCKLIIKELSTLLQCDVAVNYFNKQSGSESDFEDYDILEETLNLQEDIFKEFTESTGLLKPEPVNKKELMVGTHLLRSNCKVTNQPDWGSAFIHIKGEFLPDLNGLLKYIVSLRNEKHFHEEICELIYKRLWDIFSPDELMVTCIYTRRGGVDICPVRANKKELLPNNLSNSVFMTHRLLRQ